MENILLSSIVSNFEKKRELVFCHFVQGNDIVRIHWGDVEDNARVFMHHYQEAGVQEGDVILIFLKHVPQLYGSFIGAMLGGFVPSFMPCISRKQDPDLYWGSHKLLFQQLQPAAILADRLTLEDMVAHGLDLSMTQVMVLEDVLAEAIKADYPKSYAPNSSVGLLQHSSGTTGLKKGVALSYESIATQISSYRDALLIHEDDLIATWLPLYHDMGLIACFILPICVGIPVVQMDPFEWVAKPGRLLQLISEQRATLCWLPNFAFDHLSSLAYRNAASYDLSSLRAFINCSEVCRPETFDRFINVFKTSGIAPSMLQCCYAMAETVFAVSQTKLSQSPRRVCVDSSKLAFEDVVVQNGPGATQKELIEVGQALRGAKVSAYNSNREALPDGVVGEIGIASDFLFDGYYHQNDLTSERLSSGIYYTRDMGFILDNSLFILGRVDDLIIVNGRNLYAHEVEALVQDIEGIKRGRVIALPFDDVRNGTQALTLVVEKDGTRPNSEIRIEIMNEIFSILQITVKSVHFVAPGWLVKTTSGKISRERNVEKLRNELLISERAD